MNAFNYKKEELVGFDFQSWPVFKLNTKKLLLALGGKQENGKIVFDESDPIMDVYPRIFKDDGMAYGIDENIIIAVDRFKSEEELCVNIFRQPIPTEEQQKKLFEKWDNET